MSDYFATCPPGSSPQRTSEARILEWIAISFSRDSSWPRYWIHISCLSGNFFLPESHMWSPIESYISIITLNINGLNSPTKRHKLGVDTKARFYTHTHTHIYIHTHIWIYTHIYTHICVYVYEYICIYI